MMQMQVTWTVRAMLRGHGDSPREWTFGPFMTRAGAEACVASLASREDLLRVPEIVAHEVSVETTERGDVAAIQFESPYEQGTPVRVYFDGSHLVVEAMDGLWPCNAFIDPVELLVNISNRKPIEWHQRRPA
jgi:hypothetical protein